MKAKHKVTRRQFVSGAAVLAVSGCAEKAMPVKKETGTDRDINQTSYYDALLGTEQYLDFDFSDDQRAMILKDHDKRLATLRNLRALKIPNDSPPALVFDPRLPGQNYSQADHCYPTANPGPIPSDQNSIAFAPLVYLSQWIKTRQISSEVLTRLYLKRIAALGEKLACFITITSELALTQAKGADTELAAGTYRSPLHGIPYGLKDLMDTKDILTTWGATPYKDRIATKNAFIVTKLEEAGAVLLGKTSCGAIAYGDIWFDGVTRNPWNPLEGSSGSSAGSAAATAAGLAGFAIGTETLGSIISPSARCGTAGLRPTFGRVGRTGTMSLCWSLDKIGPICRGVEDTALVLAVLNGPDDQDPSSINMGFAYDGKQELSGVKVGYDPRWFSSDKSNAVERSALDVARQAGIELKEIQFPDIDPRPLYLLLGVESASAFQELTKNSGDKLLRRQDDRAWPNTWRKSRLLTAVDLLQIDRFRRQLMQTMHQVFADVDAILGPNYAGNLLPLTNFTGQPQLTLRAGFETRALDPAFEEIVAEGLEDRLPHNISLWAPLFEEGLLVGLGRALEEGFKCATERPPGMELK